MYRINMKLYGLYVFKKYSYHERIIVNPYLIRFLTYSLFPKFDVLLQKEHNYILMAYCKTEVSNCIAYALELLQSCTKPWNFHTVLCNVFLQ